MTCEGLVCRLFLSGFFFFFFPQTRAKVVQGCGTVNVSKEGVKNCCIRGQGLPCAYKYLGTCGIPNTPTPTIPAGMGFCYLQSITALVVYSIINST
jgi:hypothetical protein